MSTCEHCAGRGWGIREVYVRRCEVCCRFDDDDAAREVATTALAAFALRERPEAYLAPDGAMRCPWCNHLPSNVGIDNFWLLSEGTCLQRALVGRIVPYPGEDDDGLRLLTGDDSFEDVPVGDLHLACPNPGCGKTFQAPDLDFDLDPERVDGAHPPAPGTPQALPVAVAVAVADNDHVNVNAGGRSAPVDDVDA